nr:mitochondrial K+-H+ exchange-related protein [uncultured bacterium]
MDVYLLPVGDNRYELYCEVADEPDDGAAEAPKGFFRGLMHRFREMIKDAERERRQGVPEGVRRGWLARQRAKMLRWVAESIAEQRLLWHLRKQHAATLHHPDDIDGSRAAEVLREQLTSDLKKHRFWLAIDSLLMVVLGVVLFAIPGPNVVGYYFAFRVVGHFLSFRGATQGLNVVTWHQQQSAPLTELRRVLTLEPAVREDRVNAVAQTLRLEHLVSFFERSAVST